MVYKADVGRFDGELKTIAFNEGDSVNIVLGKAGITIHEGENVNNESGDEINISDNAVNGETYYIVGNYKQGNEEEKKETEETEEETEEKKDEKPTEPKE